MPKTSRKIHLQMLGMYDSGTNLLLAILARGLALTFEPNLIRRGLVHWN